MEKEVQILITNVTTHVLEITGTEQWSTDADSNFYYAGDTALTYDMKLIGDYKNIDLAFLPIGNNFTMGIDNAVIAADFIRCDRIIGMHYDTFGFIKINHDEAKQKFANAGKELILMNIGETLNHN